MWGGKYILRVVMELQKGVEERWNALARYLCLHIYTESNKIKFIWCHQSWPLIFQSMYDIYRNKPNCGLHTTTEQLRSHQEPNASKQLKYKYKQEHIIYTTNIIYTICWRDDLRVYPHSEGVALNRRFWCLQLAENVLRIKIYIGFEIPRELDISIKLLLLL